MYADLRSLTDGDRLRVDFTHTLDEWYTLPMTLKTRIPAGWQSVVVAQGDQSQQPEVRSDNNGSYILYRALPNDEPIVIEQAG